MPLIKYVNPKIERQLCNRTPRRRIHFSRTPFSLCYTPLVNAIKVPSITIRRRADIVVPLLTPSISDMSINPIAQQYFKMFNVFKEYFGQSSVPKV